MALYTVQPSQVVNPNDINQITNLLNGTTMGIQITNSGRIRAQLTGATSGSGGYVGQVSGAAPASGTFVTGDAVTDGTMGTLWVCNSGGTSGTWSALPAQVATQKLGVAAASVTFSSLPAFNRYKVFWYARASDASVAEPIFIQLNGDTGNNYLWEVNQANNATVNGTSSGGAVAHIQIGTMAGNSATANYFSAGEFTIDGAQGSLFKIAQGTAAAFSTTSNMWNGTYSGQWNSTAVVTSVTIFPGNVANFVAGSQFSVYGWM